MEALKTYEDFLKANGLEVRERYACPEPGCGKVGPAFTLVDVSEEGKPSKFICSTCHINEQDEIAYRTRMVEAHERELADPWDCEHGRQLRARRNILLEMSNWAIQPDSPLSRVCKLMFVEYRKALNRLTVDYPSPHQAVMPEAPELEYDNS